MKWPPVLTSVRPARSSCVRPVQKWILGSGRITHGHARPRAGGSALASPKSLRTPLDHRRVVVRVRDRDLGDPPQLRDPRDRRVVHERDAVPQDIPFLCLNQECSLADPELWLGVDRVEAGLFLLDDVFCATIEAPRASSTAGRPD